MVRAKSKRQHSVRNLFQRGYKRRSLILRTSVVVALFILVGSGYMFTMQKYYQRQAVSANSSWTLIGREPETAVTIRACQTKADSIYGPIYGIRVFFDGTRSLNSSGVTAYIARFPSPPQIGKPPEIFQSKSASWNSQKVAELELQASAILTDRLFASTSNSPGVISATAHDWLGTNPADLVRCP